MLTEEEVIDIKKQLAEHIERNFPDDKKDFAKSQIESMDSERLEEFLVKNNLVSGQNNQCIFCSIISGDVPNYKIDENSEAISILEINPVSKGHCLIIPKRHIKEGEEIPKDAKKLGDKTSKKIKAKLKPKKIEMIDSRIFGHPVINVLPIYANENISSKRQAAKKEELEEVQNLLKAKEKEESWKNKKTKKSPIKKIAEEIKKFEEKLWLPQRIP